MVKNCISLVFIIMVLLTTTVYADNESIISENITAVETLKRDVVKLRRGMTISEFEKIMGETPFTVGSGIICPLYLYGDGEVLRVDYDIFENGDVYYWGLGHVTNKDGFDLLATEYTAKVANFPVLINNEEITTLNPVVTIHNKAYIPLEEFEKFLNIKVEWNRGKNQMELTVSNGKANHIEQAAAKNNEDNFDLLSTEYIAKVANFPVLINNEKITTSNPIVTIHNKTYIPLKEFEKFLNIKVEWNREKDQVELTVS